MPILLFENDLDRRLGDTFCLEALARGVCLHPSHTLFLSAAHREADIDGAPTATDGALAAVARL